MSDISSIFLDYDTVSADDLDPSPLQNVAPNLVLAQGTRQVDVSRSIEGRAIVLLNKLRMTREVIAETKSLRLIALAATGTNNVDLDAAREYGVAVCNIRDYCTPSVVQHVLAVILALTQRLAATAYLYHDWRRKASTAEGRLTWQQPFSNIPALFIGDLFAGNVHSRNLFPEKPLPRWDEDYSYYGFTLRAEYRLFPQVTLTPGVQYSGHRNLRRGNHSANTALPASPCDDCGPHDHHLENDSWWWFLRLTRTF